MGRLIAIVVALAVGACMTGAQQEQARMSSAAAQGQADVDACAARMVASAPYQALQGKIPAGGNSPPPLTLQANTAKPTAGDVDLLYALHEQGIAPCRAVTLESLAKIHPALVGVKTDQYTQFDALYLRLVNGQATWGEFAQGFYHLNQATNAKMQATSAQIQQQLGQAHNYEMAERRAAASAFRQWSYQQQLLNNQRQLIQQQSAPRMTTCNYVGTNLSCTTF